MKENLSLKGSDLVPVIKYVIESGGEFKLLVTGSSMSPILINERDYVFLVSAKDHNIKKGDIVFIKRHTGEYILHRVYKLIPNNKFIMNGDGQEWVEVVNNNQVLARVYKFERNGREVLCSNIIYKFVVYIWMLLRPIRYQLYRLRKCIRIIFKKEEQL